MSTNVSTSNFVRKKKKCARSDNQEKRLVCNSTEFSISSQECRPHLSAHMTTTTSFSDTELKLRDRMRSFRDNTKARKKRLTSSSREYSRPKKNSTSSTGHSSRSRNTMKS